MIKKIIGIGLLAVFLAGCDQPPAEVEEMEKVVSAAVGMVVERITLTVAESKRLIARGLARYAPVVEKMENGVVIEKRCQAS
jgi:uncharacterized lipoprotein YajG